MKTNCKAVFHLKQLHQWLISSNLSWYSCYFQKGVQSPDFKRNTIFIVLSITVIESKSITYLKIEDQLTSSGQLLWNILMKFNSVCGWEYMAVQTDSAHLWQKGAHSLGTGTSSKPAAPSCWQALLLGVMLWLNPTDWHNLLLTNRKELWSHRAAQDQWHKMLEVGEQRTLVFGEANRG